MKQFSILAVTVFTVVLSPAAQDIFENPAKPLNPDAGRVIRLKEVARITDESGKYYFKGPWDIKVGGDGSIYILEPDSFLKFDLDGRFIRNFYKKGEGPGELNQNLTDFLILEDGVVLYSSNMNKLIRMDKQGKTVEEFRPQPGPYSGLAGYHSGRYYFFDREQGDYERKTGIYEDYLRLHVVTSAGEADSTSVVFPIKVSLYVDSRYSSRGDLCRMQKVNKDTHSIFLFHTPEYSVKLLDLDKTRVLRSFKREYKRVPFVFNRKLPYARPLPKFCNDIQRLLIHQNNLWVVTSTFDKNKGILVDVFNKEGRYLDNFYLPLFRLLTEERASYYVRMDTYQNFLFVIEMGEDGLITVAKYEMIDI